MNRQERRRFEAQLRTQVKRLPLCNQCKRPKKPRNWDADERIIGAYCHESCEFYERFTPPVDDWPPVEKRRKKGRGS